MSESRSITSLYRRHAPAVFRRAQQILGNSADAHEVVQDLFLSLFERPEQFSGRSSATTFLYGATTHACLNRLRNERNRSRLLSDHLEPEAESAGSLSAEQLLVLRRALASMPADLAEAAVYYCVDGLSQDEIATLLACSRRHVGNLLSRVNEWGRAQEASSC